MRIPLRQNRPASSRCRRELARCSRCSRQQRQAAAAIRTTGRHRMNRRSRWTQPRNSLSIRRRRDPGHVVHVISDAGERAKEWRIPKGEHSAVPADQEVAATARCRHDTDNVVHANTHRRQRSVVPGRLTGGKDEHATVGPDEVVTADGGDNSYDVMGVHAHPGSEP